MGRTKTKFTTSEIYISTWRNLENLIEYETHWLNSNNCKDIETQKRLISDLQATLRVLKYKADIIHNISFKS